MGYDAQLLFRGEGRCVPRKYISRLRGGSRRTGGGACSSNSCFRSDAMAEGEYAGRPDRRKKYPFRNWSRMLSAIYRPAKSAVSLSRSIDLNHFHDVLITTSFSAPFGVGSRQPTAKPDDQSGDPYISPFVAVALVFRHAPCSNRECVSHWWKFR